MRLLPPMRLPPKRLLRRTACLTEPRDSADLPAAAMRLPAEAA